jgi:hypothetical protein
LESWCELVVGLRLLVFRGMSLLCLGDEFRGVDAGLEDLDEPARNLSRKCCSQSAEGIMWFDLVWFWFEMMVALVVALLVLTSLGRRWFDDC